MHLMIVVLLFIKHNLHFIWTIVECFNGLLFGLLFCKRIIFTAKGVLDATKHDNLNYRILNKDDLVKLHDFSIRQPKENYRYFNPHAFDVETLNKLYSNRSLLMMGVFDRERLVGYFLLRFFINRQAFAGYFVDHECQGCGIAKKMGRIMLNICWNNQFRVFSTVSKDNTRALNCYKAINDFKIIKELDNNYICLEYLKDKKTL